MAGGNLNVQGVGNQSAIRDASGPALRQNQETSAPRARPAASNEARIPTESPRSDEDFSREQIREISSVFGEAVALVNKGVRVQIDESSEQIITQIIDRDTDEIIRQIPPEELLEVSRRLRAFVGALLDLEI